MRLLGSFTQPENMDIENALAFLDTLPESKSLNDVQELVFRGAWEEKAYEEIAALAGYDANYLRDVGSKLWRSLSNSLGEKVTKNNFRSVLRRRLKQTPNSSISIQEDTPVPPAPEANINQDQDSGKDIDTSILLGGTDKLATLGQSIEPENSYLVAIINLGENGKNTLPEQLVEQLAHRSDSPLYFNLRNDLTVEKISAENLSQFTLKRQKTELEILDRKIKQLLQYLCDSNCLLILNKGGVRN